MSKAARMTLAEIEAHQAKVHGYNKNHSASKVADTERHSCNVSEKPHKNKKALSPVVIRFTHYRRKLADVDNFYTKHFIDSLVKNGLLPDDSPQFVKEVRHRQVKVESWEDERFDIEIISDC